MNFYITTCECYIRHTYRRTDHATVTCVAIGGIVLYYYLILCGITESGSAYCDICYRSVVCPSVCMSSVTVICIFVSLLLTCTTLKLSGSVCNSTVIDLYRLNRFNVT